MNSNLQKLYQKVNSVPLMKMVLPERLGEGRIARLSTPQHLSLSSWNMKYFRDTQVEGFVGSDMRLLFCLGEGAEWKTDCGMIRIDTGEAYFCLDENDYESMCYSKNSNYMFYSISMPREKFSAMLQNYSIDRTDLFSGHNSSHFRISPDIYSSLDNFSRLEYTEEGIDMMRLDAAMYEIIAMGMKAAKQSDVRPRNLSSTEMQLLQELKLRIEADPASVPNLYTLAREYGFCKTKLTRSFKNIYGKSLHAYVIEARLSEAARLLKETDMTISEIAERSGYLKTSQFSAAFKKRFGVTPSDF